MKTLTKQELEQKILKILITPKNKPIVAVSDIRVAYKDEVIDLLTLFLDSFEEIVGENDHYTAGFTTRNELRKELRAKIQELRGK